MSLFERPGVDRVAAANQLEQAWFAERGGGPLVHALQPRHDDRVVEKPAKTLLVGDLALDVKRERIAVWEYPRSERKTPAIPSRGSPSRRPSGENRPSARRGAP